MRYDVSYYTDDSRYDSLLSRATYKSDAEVLQVSIEKARYYNQVQPQFKKHPITHITIYRLVRTKGDSYWKTIVDHLAI